ncbi:hypothetical protein OF83DRAFT_1125142 [Amylostereum chailletii]|nr:hypothetical protein OF83DRAFT_1125142 [Amylostereum chailletii]
MPSTVTTRSQSRPENDPQITMPVSPIVKNRKERRRMDTLDVQPLKGQTGLTKRRASTVYVELPLRPIKKPRLSESAAASSSVSALGRSIVKPKPFHQSEVNAKPEATERSRTDNWASQEAAFKHFKAYGDDIQRQRRQVEKDQEELAREREEMHEEKTKLRKARVQLQNAKRDMSIRQQELDRREADTERAAEQRLAQCRGLLGELIEKDTTGAEGIVTHLEEFFECPLCLDIIATPYTLSAYKCGHTFCALCLLKWYFSTLHECGDWHQPVTCPLCRAVPIMTAPVVNSSQTRAEWTFPFVPARMVDSLLEDSVHKLHNMSTAFSGAFQAVHDIINPISPRKKQKQKHDPGSTLLVEWGDGGPRWIDWLARKARGRVEMDCLTDKWTTFTPVECLAMKVRLGV